MVSTLFDFDGVLVDTEPLHLAAFRAVLAARGVTITDEAYAAKYLGFDDAGAFRAMLRDAGREPTEQLVAQLIEEKNPAFMALAARELRVFPGAVDLVRRRAASGTIGIVSGALEREIRFCLEKMGVAGAVRFIVSAERTRAGKPDPEGYLLALDELARAGTSTKAVVVEDSISGIEAAKRAGLRCVAVASSYAKEELVRAGADAVVTDLLALDDALLDEGLA
jgi:HAD superfamily hydrolase (TIGR01509 family)